MAEKNILEQFKIDQEEFLENLNIFSKQLEKGDYNYLHDLKELLGKWNNYTALEISEQVDPELITMMWLLDKVILELWTNLSGDSKGFPKDKGFVGIIEISHNLGSFIQDSLFKEEKVIVMPKFTKVIDLYYTLLRICEKEYHRSYNPKEWTLL